MAARARNLVGDVNMMFPFWKWLVGECGRSRQRAHPFARGSGMSSEGLRNGSIFLNSANERRCGARGSRQIAAVPFFNRCALRCRGAPARDFLEHVPLLASD